MNETKYTKKSKQSAAFIATGNFRQQLTIFLSKVLDIQDAFLFADKAGNIYVNHLLAITRNLPEIMGVIPSAQTSKLFASLVEAATNENNKARERGEEVLPLKEDLPTVLCMYDNEDSTFKVFDEKTCSAKPQEKPINIQVTPLLSVDPNDLQDIVNLIGFLDRPTGRKNFLPELWIDMFKPGVKKVYAHYGEGREGKGLATNLLQIALGDKAVAQAPTPVSGYIELSANMKIAGKFAAFSQEETIVHKAQRRVLEITGGSFLPCREIGSGNPVDVWTSAHFHLTSNQPPELPDRANWRGRLRFIEYVGALESHMKNDDERSSLARAAEKITNGDISRGTVLAALAVVNNAHKATADKNTKFKYIETETPTVDRTAKVIEFVSSHRATSAHIDRFVEKVCDLSHKDAMNFRRELFTDGVLMLDDRRRVVVDPEYLASLEDAASSQPIVSASEPASDRISTAISFPCNKNKAPAVKSWKSTADDYQQVIALDTPPVNAGIIPATADIVVIDVDQKNGIDGLESLRSEFPELVSEKPTVTTPSGGYHYYIDWRDQHRDKVPQANGKLPGVDIRHADGYVCVPTPHPENGYNFFSNKIYHPSNRLVEWLKSKPTPKPKLTQSSAQRMMPLNSYRIDQLKAGVPPLNPLLTFSKGERNEKLYKLSFAEFTDKRYTADEVTAHIERVGANSGLSSSEVSTIIASARTGANEIV